MRFLDISLWRVGEKEMHQDLGTSNRKELLPTPLGEAGSRRKGRELRFGRADSETSIKCPSGGIRVAADM